MLILDCISYISILLKYAFKSGFVSNKHHINVPKSFSETFHKFRFFFTVPNNGTFYSWNELFVMIQCSKCLSKELTLVLSDTRELDRVHSTK